MTNERFDEIQRLDEFDQREYSDCLTSAQQQRHELLQSLKEWRRWAQFVFLGGGPVVLDHDDAMRNQICKIVDLRDERHVSYLIALNGLMAYRNTVVGNAAPAVKKQFERSTHPIPGDLVLEISTIWKWMRSAFSPGPALGILLRVVREPMPSDPEDDAERERLGMSKAMEEVVYIRPLFDPEKVGEYRWVNASFIALHSEVFPYD